MYRINKFDDDAAKMAKERWNSIAKPLYGLGKFEKTIIDIAGISGTSEVDISKRAVLVMCADNGIVEEGVTQTGAEVTAVVTENFAKGKTSVCAMARTVGAEVFPVDVGVDADIDGVKNCKIAYGTRNFLKEPAMSYAEAGKAVNIGIECVKELAKKRYKIIVTGEMGIGNTTTSAAVTAVILKRGVAEVTGRGAGLSSEGLHRKIEVIKAAIEKHKPNPNDAIDVLSKVGGFDIAALAGVFIGGAIYRIPIVIDGVISSAAALCAEKIAPGCKDFMIASHSSKESAEELILSELGKSAVIYADMCLGEGTGGVMLLPLLDAALSVYRDMETFEAVEIEQYEELV